MRLKTSIVLATALVSAPALAAETVNIDNFIRAETDGYMAKDVARGCFAKFCHARGPVPVAAQQIIRSNRDTPYSIGVFDVTSPVTITMPDAGKRFQSIMVINQDHYIKHVGYTPGPVVLDQSKIGTRYAYVLIRTFVDPNDPNDMKALAGVQDRITVTQASPGKFEVPDWDDAQRSEVRTALLAGARFVPDSKGMFGDTTEIDPVRRLFGTASGWGGNRQKDAIYLNRTAPDNSGATPYTLTLGAVPVDGFWSVTVYNAKGFYEAPETAISTNSVTARPNKDGTTTIRFGGDPKAPNYLRIMPGWNYTVRLYRPRAEILSGTYQFPDLVPAR